MYRRELVLSVDGYHAAFKHCEDLDLWLRLATRTRIANIPEKLIRYRHYADQVSSRHATEQQIGAAVAKIAYRERLAGRPDPTEAQNSLPPIDELEALFGREGIAREVRSRVAPGLLYSKAGARDHRTVAAPRPALAAALRRHTANRPHRLAPDHAVRDRRARFAHARHGGG